MRAIASAAWLGYELKLMASVGDAQKSPLRPNEKSPAEAGLGGRRTEIGHQVRV